MKRRDFLKLAGTALAGAALPQPLTALAAGGAPPEDQVAERFVPLRRGRVLTSSVTVWDQIEAPHSPVKRYARDEVLLLGEGRARCGARAARTTTCGTGRAAAGCTQAGSSRWSSTRGPPSIARPARTASGSKSSSRRRRRTKNHPYHI